jgi:hypothetical protein
VCVTLQLVVAKTAGKKGLNRGKAVFIKWKKASWCPDYRMLCCPLCLGLGASVSSFPVAPLVPPRHHIMGDLGMWSSHYKGPEKSLSGPTMHSGCFLSMACSWWAPETQRSKGRGNLLYDYLSVS